jgi:hypothetical protein
MSPDALDPAAAADPAAAHAAATAAAAVAAPVPPATPVTKEEDDEYKKIRVISFSQLGKAEEIEGEKKKEFKPFIEFTSDDPSEGGEQLVTKKQFEEILRKNYLDKNNKIYGTFSICKMKLKGDEAIKIGDSEVKEQHFIDIKDKKNDIRFFIDEEAYEDLNKYKNTLYDKFKDYLKSDTDLEKDKIGQQINAFNSLSDIKPTVLTVPTVPPATTDSVANKLGLNNEEKIAKKAQDLTELYINKRFARGMMSTEESQSSGNFDDKKFGFFKVVRNQKRPKDIRVYKSEEKTELKILNVSVGDNEIIQFKTSDSGEIESGRHFKRTNQYAAFQRVDPKDFSSDSRGTRIRVFNEKTVSVNNNDVKIMERLKINVGVDNEDNFIKSKKNVVFVENVIEMGDEINIGKSVKIIRDEKRPGKLIIKYGENNKSTSCLSYHGGFIYNKTPNEVGGQSFNLKAYSSIIEKITPEPKCLKSHDTKHQHHSVIFKILDKKNDSFSYVELTRKGSLTSPFKSTYKAKILERSSVEKFDPRSAVYSGRQQ